MILPRTVLVGLVTVPTLLLTASCSGSVEVGANSVSASDVEKQVTSAITDQDRTGVTVDCPDDLEAEKGATIECDSTHDGGNLRATVTVTSVEGSDVNFDIDALPYLTAEEAGQQAATELAAQIGASTPPDIVCPDELVATVGTTMICTLTDAGETYDTTLTVTDDANGETGFDIQVADTPS
jgi:hypothetical protein